MKKEMWGIFGILLFISLCFVFLFTLFHFTGNVIDSIPANCVDTDKGIDYYVKGNVTFNRAGNSSVTISKDYCYVTNSTGSWVKDVFNCSSSLCNLIEYQCNGQNPAGVSQSCPDGCKDGACLLPVIAPTCKDSDSGMDYYVKGNITYNDFGNSSIIISKDYCYITNSTGSWIKDVLNCSGDYCNAIEYGCRGQGRTSGSQLCTSGCYDGACIQSQTPTVNLNSTLNATSTLNLNLTSNSTSNSTSILNLTVSTNLPLSSVKDNRLVGYWDFDEGSGNIVHDKSGNGFDAYNSDATFLNWTKGVKGNALSFSRLQSVYVQNRLILSSPKENISISFWFYPRYKSSTILGNDILISKGTSFDSYLLINFYRTLLLKGGLLVSGNADGEFGMLSKQPALEFDKWNHIVFEYDSKKAGTLYLNGFESENSYLLSNRGFLTPNSIYSLTFGNTDGILDEIKIYNRTLTPKEIYNLYNETDLSLGNGPVISTNQNPLILDSWRTYADINIQTNIESVCRASTQKNIPFTNKEIQFVSVSQKNHTASITEISQGNNYTYYISCADSKGNINSAEYILNVNVLKDTANPQIREVKVVNVGDDSAIIYWTTNERADSMVEYGTDEKLTSQTWRDFSLALPHAVFIQNLTQEKKYFFRIHSKDEAGNEAISQIYNFNLPTYSQTKEYFVSPNGNDSYPGTIQMPFKTIEHARDIIKQEKYLSNLNFSRFIVTLRGGFYPLNFSLIFDASNSGISGSPTVYRSYPGESANIIGGKQIINYSKVTDNSILQRLNQTIKNQVYEINLKQEGIFDYGELTQEDYTVASISPIELFINGKPLKIARYPNNGWVEIKNLLEGNSVGKFTYNDTRPSSWKDLSNIWVFGQFYTDWVDSVAKIKTINLNSKSIELEKPYSSFGYWNNSWGGQYYYFNVLEELDSPGEYFVDKEKGKIYFILPDSNPNPQIFVSTLNQTIINFTRANNIILRDLSISYGRAEGVYALMSNNISLEKCTINNVGTTGLYSVSNAVGCYNCDIFNTGIQGVVLSGGDLSQLNNSNNYLLNSRIHDVGYRVIASVRLLTIHGVFDYIANNEFYNSDYLGVVVAGNNHIIEFNNIHDIVRRTIDGGAIYVPRPYSQQGTIIRYNNIYNIVGSFRSTHDSKGAVYLDAFGSGATIFGNIFTNTSKGVTINGGRDNIIKNNILLSESIGFRALGIGISGYNNLFQIPIVDVSNTSPIVIKLSRHFDFETFGIVNMPNISITGVRGNTAANGNWSNIQIKSINEIILIGSNSNGNYLGGGDIQGEDSLGNLELKQNSERYKITQSAYKDYYPWLSVFNEEDFSKPEGNIISKNIVLSTLNLIGDINRFYSFPYLVSKNNSFNVDPGLVDVNSQNYKLKPNSIASNLGFIEIPFERIGLFQISIDKNSPNFVNPSNKTIKQGVSFEYNLDAVDYSGISCFSVNDSSFNIDCSGVLKNKTSLKSGLYWLNITVNDTLNNKAFVNIFVNVTPLILCNNNGVCDFEENLSNCYNDCFKDNFPIVSQIFPNDNQINVTSTSLFLAFRCDATDDINLKNITLNIFNKQNNALIYSATSFISGIRSSSSWNYSLPPGNYSWSCSVYDSNFQLNVSSARNLNVTSLILCNNNGICDPLENLSNCYNDCFKDNFPRVYQILPSNNQVNITSTILPLTFQCDATDDINLKNITLNIFNKQNNVLIYSNTSLVNGIGKSLIWNYSLPPGNYSWSCSVYDNSSQLNVSSLRDISIGSKIEDSDGDGIDDLMDKCPKTPKKLIQEVNTKGCLIPKNGSNILLGDIKNSDLNNMTYFGIRNSFVKVEFFNQAVDLVRENSSSNQIEEMPLDLTKGINLSYNQIDINSSSVPELNKSATLTFYQLNFAHPVIYRDNQICSECIFVNYNNGTLIVNVTHFTIYEIREALTPIYCGDAICNNNENCSTCASDCGNCNSGGGGGGGGGTKSSGGNKEVNICNSNWSCDEWQPCLNGIKNRNCFDKNNCKNNLSLPILVQSCNVNSSISELTCNPNWVCGDWTECIDGSKKRTCQDLNNCGVSIPSPELEVSCTQNSNKLFLFILILSIAIILIFMVLLIKLIILRKNKFDQRKIVNEKLQAFVNEAKNLGYSEEKIVKMLEKNGWNKKDILRQFD